MARDGSIYRRAEAKLWEHVGAEPRDYRVKLATGGEVRVQELGEGPPVLFIHGGAISGASWALLTAQLPQFRCIMIDRPGCGLSDPIDGGPITELDELKAYADRLLSDLLDALELEHAAVAATSYGGFMAFRGAAAAPDRVSKLIEYSWLIGAPGGSAPIVARMGAIPGMQSMTAKMPMTRSMVKVALAQVGLGKAIKTGAFDDVMLDWAHALMRHTDTMGNDVRSTPKVFLPIKGQNDAVLLSDELLSKLTMPVLFAWGESDPNGGAAVAKEFVPRVPHGELVIIPGAEHAPWIDDLDACVEATVEFLSR